jgi:DNA polymerase III subunit delta
MLGLYLAVGFIFAKMSAAKILGDWKKGNFKPIYWLEGDEPYFIDEVMHYAEHHLLSESEIGFNLSVFYGKDADWVAIVNACRRYPMFADKQVVLLKEAQHMREIDKLEPYIENPLTSTIFVVSYKDKKVDGRSKLAKTLKTNGELLSTKKIADYQLPDWTKQMVEAHGLQIQPKALSILVDHVGNDLSRLQNEVEKLKINLSQRTHITDDDIEKYIGISKEFNAFELQDALGKKDLAKAVRIIQYFRANPKAAPIQLVLPTLFNYFSKLYSVYGLPNITEQAIAPLFYNNIYAAKTAMQSIQLYGPDGIQKTLLLLHEYNLRSIGIRDAGTTDADLLKELVVKMIS